MKFGDMVYGKGLQSPMAEQISFGMYIRNDGKKVEFLSMGFFTYKHRSPNDKYLPLFNYDRQEWSIFSSSLMAPFEPLQWEMLSMRAHEFIALIFTNMPKGLEK